MQVFFLCSGQTAISTAIKTDILQHPAVNEEAKEATAILSDEPADRISVRDIYKSADLSQCKTSATGQTCKILGESDEEFRHFVHRKFTLRV